MATFRHVERCKLEGCKGRPAETTDDDVRKAIEGLLPNEQRIAISSRIEGATVMNAVHLRRWLFPLIGKLWLAPCWITDSEEAERWM